MPVKERVLSQLRRGEWKDFGELPQHDTGTVVHVCVTICRSVHYSKRSLHKFVFYCGRREVPSKCYLSAGDAF